MATAWKTIKTEYVTGSISYRKLAEKHKLSESSLTERAVAEHWFQQRKDYRDKTIAKAIDKIGNQEAARMARLDGVADKLLDKLEKAVSELDYVGKELTERQGDGNAFIQTKTIEYKPGGIVNQKALRELTAALKDLKEIKGIHTEMQRQEQEARINLLRKQADKDDDKTRDIVVQLEGVETFGD